MSKHIISNIKVGDLVQHTQTEKVYLVVDGSSTLLKVLDNGKHRWYSRDWMVVISHRQELTDGQLENVIGGASPQAFSNWRAETLNENG